MTAEHSAKQGANGKAAEVTVDALTEACGDHSECGAVVMDAELEPVAGPGSPVNPAIYAGARYQRDKRWERSDSASPTAVIVIDNVPSQANRLEAALAITAEMTGLPRLELCLDVDDLGHLPPHLPRRLSSLSWPHRNADGYLRDALRDGKQFTATPLGKSLIDATASSAAALVSWFPQALLLGFWQSHLGKKRSQAKHARAWVSEIVGWDPAPGEADHVRTFGVKGDPINIGDVGKVESRSDDLLDGWSVDSAKRAAERDKMSSIGHGQVPFKAGEEALAPVSFRRITQRATLSFPQLRRITLGDGFTSDQNAAARALIAAVGLHAHQTAFSRPFALRSGTDLTAVRSSTCVDSEPVALGETVRLVADALEAAQQVGVPTDGWGQEPVLLTPNASLIAAIVATWPPLEAADAS
ncbi:MAG: type I-U CRISPR-associated RAMP protein Csb1/Cas7u [Acidimicrobiaceae bacterium]|nr:type I-U CRISPR-associated RAMP protein Csb1/Cas7u [Acidimicrobiaceae bacterium]MDE0493962.1 type I-U CRISPR-associated RAMP protein Csb1/Cas7u [Acidimicrobiaceae bacterium]